MPLSINVGLSRKASRDYQSTGYSINVTAELDQTLLARPDELQRQVDDLFAQAQSALDRQAGATAAPRQDRPPRPNAGDGYAGRANGNGRYARNGNGNGHANGARNGRGGDAPATASQRRAIASIADRLNLDADNEAREISGACLDDLTLRQASELIDHLKGLQPAGGNGHNGRH